MVYRRTLQGLSICLSTLCGIAALELTEGPPAWVVVMLAIAVGAASWFALNGMVEEATEVARHGRSQVPSRPKAADDSAAEAAEVAP